MPKIKKIVLAFILSLILYSCGYSVLNNSLGNNYKIVDISLSGEKRINYNIRSKLMFDNSKTNNNLLSLEINTKKYEVIKNKNIKNEITAYQLTITSIINYKLIGKVKEDAFSITNTGDYDVSKHRLNTLNNKKKLEKTLTDDIIKKISNKLNIITNDN